MDRLIGRVRPSWLSQYWSNIFLVRICSHFRPEAFWSGLFGLVLGRAYVAEGFLNGILLLFVKFWIDVQRYYVSKLQNFKKFKIKKKMSSENAL